MPVGRRSCVGGKTCSAWAAAAQRPGDKVTYTNNWPHEPLVGNTPTGDIVVWTGVSILFLLAGIGAMATWHATRKQEDGVPAPRAIRSSRARRRRRGARSGSTSG